MCNRQLFEWFCDKQCVAAEQNVVVFAFGTRIPPTAAPKDSSAAVTQIVYSLISSPYLGHARRSDTFLTRFSYLDHEYETLPTANYYTNAYQCSSQTNSAIHYFTILP